MSFKSQLKKLLTGLSVPQEYCCLGLEGFLQPFYVFLTVKNQDVQMDVTKSQLFLGYKPLIIGLPCNVNSQEYNNIREQHQICLHFGEHSFEANKVWRDFPADKRSVARLILRKTEEKILDEQVLLVYEGERGEHSFLNSMQQSVNRLRERMHKRLPTNISLYGNLMDQVRIAYAIPRVISIITVSDGSLINLFPTDLHGPVGVDVYVGSLRIGGMANDQVEKHKRIVISEVEVSSYKKTYALGKNHMAHLQKADQFSLYQERSIVFGFPLPAAVVHYHELKQIDSFDHGIHRIHVYKVLHRKMVCQNTTRLAHIHRYYAQWRTDQGLKTQLFLR